MSETAVVIRTSRPNFLIMAPLCAGLGVALAWRSPDSPQLLDTVLIFVGALLAHAAVNMLNEYEDFTSGLDLHTRRTPFSGGSGALPGLPSAARHVFIGAMAALGMVIAIGMYFLWQQGLPMLVLGGAGVALVLTYTRWITRSPLLCLLAPGLGFGPVMVLGTLVALGAPINAAAVAVSVISLLLVSTLLLMNQIPDAEADRRGGRYHAVIVLGVYKAALLASAMLVSSYGILALALTRGWLPAGTAMGFATLPLAVWIAMQLPQVVRDSQRLPSVLAVNVANLLATLALLIVGLSV